MTRINFAWSLFLVSFLLTMLSAYSPLRSIEDWKYRSAESDEAEAEEIKKHFFPAYSKDRWNVVGICLGESIQIVSRLNLWRIARVRGFRDTMASSSRRLSHNIWQRTSTRQILRRSKPGWTIWKLCENMQYMYTIFHFCINYEDIYDWTVKKTNLLTDFFVIYLKYYAF